jgi:hypothetical protein
MVQIKSLIYNSVPEGLPVAGKDLVVESRELVWFSPPTFDVMLMYVS